MEESQTSESVAVLPDMSEPLTSETEEAAALTSEHEAHPVAVTASVTAVPGVPGVPGVGVPVSLPVGSIIGVANSTNGTTFNVITSDQLQVLGLLLSPTLKEFQVPKLTSNCCEPSKFKVSFGVSELTSKLRSYEVGKTALVGTYVRRAGVNMLIKAHFRDEELIGRRVFFPPPAVLCCS